MLKVIFRLLFLITIAASAVTQLHARCMISARYDGLQYQLRVPLPKSFVRTHGSFRSRKKSRVPSPEPFVPSPVKVVPLHGTVVPSPEAVIWSKHTSVPSHRTTVPSHGASVPTHGFFLQTHAAFGLKNATCLPRHRSFPDLPRPP